MNPDYIPAEIRHIETLLAFMQDFYEHERLKLNEEAARCALQQLLTDDSKGRVWLIEADGEMVGYTVLTFGFSLEFHGRDAFVDELFIVSEWRGRGIGRQTLGFLAAACRTLGIAALHLEVERANTVAQELYRSAGFVDHDRYLMTRWVSDKSNEE
ncbi:MAG TPA: GNAT family N-acetyltransferase [Blastocatellia bacterium]|nr:GNAT family N-acetyltransferase [Blastocatellia bacterium]